jgi:hypothetical protein
VPAKKEFDLTHNFHPGIDRVLIFFWTAPYPWTTLLAFFQNVSVRAGRMPLTD